VSLTPLAQWTKSTIDDLTTTQTTCSSSHDVSWTREWIRSTSIHHPPAILWLLRLLLLLHLRFTITITCQRLQIRQRCPQNFTDKISAVLPFDVYDFISLLTHDHTIALLSQYWNTTVCPPSQKLSQILTGACFQSLRQCMRERKRTCSFIKKLTNATSTTDQV